MDMKHHILAALREEYDQWTLLLAGMTELQITTPQPSSQQSIKDDIAHLHAWQQRSIARVEAARSNQAPHYPAWPAELNPDTADNPHQINAWIADSTRDLAWSVVEQRWRAGFLQFLEGAAAISERDLLDSDRYPWLGGYPLALVLLASYDHHHEHLEALRAAQHMAS